MRGGTFLTRLALILLPVFIAAGNFNDSEAAEGSVITAQRGTGPIFSHLSADQINFGTAAVGAIKATTVTVNNAGTAPLHVISVTVPEAPFSRISDTCSGLQLAPADMCSIEIWFAPTEAGSYTGSFSINTDGGNKTIRLTGSR